jgi:hypothetical protein
MDRRDECSWTSGVRLAPVAFVSRETVAKPAWTRTLEEGIACIPNRSDAPTCRRFLTRSVGEMFHVKLCRRVRRQVLTATTGMVVGW